VLRRQIDRFDRNACDDFLPLRRQPIVGGTILFHFPRVAKNADKPLGSSLRDALLVELLQKQFDLASNRAP
jgi:hypothetical protein